MSTIDKTPTYGVPSGCEDEFNWESSGVVVHERREYIARDGNKDASIAPVILVPVALMSATEYTEFAWSP
jgi:hypothetical protein